MKKKFYVIIRSSYEEGDSGFKVYNGTKKIICEAHSIEDVYKLYPDAALITEKIN